MAENASAEHEPESVGRVPPISKTPGEPVVIEGEATEPREAGTEPPASESTPGETAPEAEPTEPPVAESRGAEPADVEPASPPLRPARKSGRAFGWGFAGAVVGAGFALAAAWFADPRAEPMRELAARLSTVEAAGLARAAADKSLEARLAAVEAEQAGVAKAAALDALDKRLAKLESAEMNPDALDKRLSKLEASTIGPEALEKRLAKLESATVNPDAIAAAQEDARAAREAAKKALDLANASAGAAPAPASVAEAPPDPRVAKLVTDEAALGDRIAKLEATLFAPKAETRVAAAEVAPRDDDKASRAIAAIALEQRLRAGEPFAAEWAALSRLGADSAQLAALKPYADAGAPNPASLGASFAKLVPAMLAAAHPESAEGPLDTLLGRMRKLVRVRAVGEVAGEDADALISRIEAALARGQVDLALTIFARLPEASRKAAGDWPSAAQARAGADSAARALREGAIAGLAAAKN